MQSLTQKIPSKPGRTGDVSRVNKTDPALIVLYL